MNNEKDDNISVSPPPSLSPKSKESNPVKYNTALTKAKELAGKLKETSDNDNKETIPTQTASGTKRSYEDDQQEYQTPPDKSIPNTHDYKRNAYDLGASKPYYVHDNHHGPGLGSEQWKPSYNVPNVPQRSQEDYSVPNHMVGLLIGKGGENLKKIERMSGVSKVQFDNDPIGNDRVVHIIGEPDQIAIARDMIRQMVSDAHVNDSSRFPVQGLNTSDQSSVIFRIPSNKVGLVIGKGGETLRDFQERSKAKIMIASDSHGDRNHERVITLVGDETATQLAKTMIEDLISASSNPPGQIYANALPTYDPNQYNTAYNLYGYGTVPRPDDDRALIPVPAYSVGLIIGRGGETIRHIQEQSGARVKVDPTNDPSPEQRIVNISGDPNCVAIARRLVEEKVTEANRTAGTRGTGYSVPPTQQYYGADYSQYNQYYAQYGYNPQYYSGTDPGYQQYPGQHPPNPNGRLNSESNTNTPANYYNHQSYSGQQPMASQEAYYQWYQQYYDAQGGYQPPQQQPAKYDKKKPGKPHGKSDSPKTNAQHSPKSQTPKSDQ